MTRRRVLDALLVLSASFILTLMVVLAWKGVI